MQDLVVLVNLDGTACRIITRKLRAEHYYCRIVAADASLEDVLAQQPRGVILAGGSQGEAAELPLLVQLMKSGLPVLALGDAALSACEALGGTLSEKATEPCVVSVQLINAPELFEEVEDGERYLPACRTLTMDAPEVEVIAQAEQGVLGFRVTQQPVWALALQIERNDMYSTRLLTNFCQNLCGCTPWWNNKAFVDRAQEEIRAACGADGHALCAISGGVDSGVCAMLGHMAIGHRLHCIFVDTGLLREGESERVMTFYRDQMGLNVQRIDASGEFLSALEGLTLPVDKEAVIFRLLRSILNRAAATLPDMRVLIQGTTYSDEQPDCDFPLEKPNAQVQLIEPVRELFKDEIRRVGEELGMPAAMTQRQPFPGSGLALRVLAEVTPERLALLRDADWMFRQEIYESNLSKRLWQYFASLAPNPVPGEDGYVVTLRAVQASEGAGAMPARLPSDLLERVSQQIREKYPEVIRVLYDLTPSKRYSQVDWR